MIAILISAKSEWRAVIEHLDPATKLTSPFGEYFFTELSGKPILFFYGGVGKVSAAASTQYVIDNWHPSTILNLGTCGGLQGEIEVGEIVMVNETVFYDILERMSDPDEVIRFFSTRLDISFVRQPFPQKVRVGRLASADQDIDPENVQLLKEKYGVVAADWESGAIAWIAQRNGIPCLILRGVTDLVSAGGGEIYNDNAAGFDQSAKRIMQSLMNALPEWIELI